MANYDTPISERFLFPVYNTPEIYKEKTGEDAPPFNAGMKPKYWFDPTAREVAKKSPTELFEYLIYVIGKDGKPSVRVIEMEALDAGSVNIPSYADGIRDNTGQLTIVRTKVPDPIKPLGPNEELVMAPFGGVPVVRNKALYEEEIKKDPINRIESLLRAIATKLGV